MHELSLCKNILQTVKQHLTPPYAKVTHINLEVGALCCVEKSALAFNFDVLKKGTVAENAILHFVDIPGEAICDICLQTVTINQYYDACPVCEQFSLSIIKGQELRIKSIEVL